ncbi:MAG TPA: ClpXP protease specificity-enhancing factor SspB [Stellaceae bacterium]|nr:ClpXP protease specificity-enhancing factor SspB [Stellaceae bacterium]
MRYDRMVERALRGVVREAIAVAVAGGLPGAHHFYITFKTGAPGVDIADTLRAKYPDEMTIVIEHQFWELTVTDEAFAVTLSFNNRPERLTIPFAAITAFVDPSVKWGLQFQETPPSEGVPQTDPQSGAQPGPQSGGEQPLRLAETPGSGQAPRPRKERGAPKLVGEKPASETAGENKPDRGKGGAKKPGEVVTLDTFRKK